MGVTGSKPVYMTILAGSTWDNPDLLLSDELIMRTECSVGELCKWRKTLAFQVFVGSNGCVTVGV